MASFDDSVRGVKPQIDTIAVASKSLRNSKKLKKVLELILAFGNYMNSNKKGPCYGFKLQVRYNCASSCFTSIFILFFCRNPINTYKIAL
jgi:hypothetical protein